MHQRVPHTIECSKVLLVISNLTPRVRSEITSGTLEHFLGCHGARCDVLIQGMSDADVKS